MSSNLSPRAARILVALVGEYIHTAEPVGSARLAQSAGLAVSSATVRNTLAELEELGYRMVIFPMSAFRVAMKATGEFFKTLREQGTQAAWLDQMQTRKELYELLEYDPAAESWPGYSRR